MSIINNVSFNSLSSLAANTNVKRNNASNSALTFTSNNESSVKNKKSNKLVKALVLCAIGVGSYLFLKKTNMGAKIREKLFTFAQGVKEKLANLLNDTKKVSEAATESGEKIVETAAQGTKNGEKVVETGKKVTEQATSASNKYPDWVDKFERQMLEKRKKREIEEAWRQYYAN